MKINSILKMSEANGPGKRGVVWFQGCSRHCKGCFNPETQPFFGGTEMSPKFILNQFDLKSISGITVSGGEPFSQPQGLKELLMLAKKKGLNTLVYSGFTYNELDEYIKGKIKNLQKQKINFAMDDIYNQIIESAKRSRPGVDHMFGL